MDNKNIEESECFSPRLNEQGLIPAIATDYDSGEVLMFAWMNREAIEKTMETGEAHYWSRSRKTLWHKGGESGNVQKVREIRTDCDQDALWIKVEQTGQGACHTGRQSCFYRRIERDSKTLTFIQNNCGNARVTSGDSSKRY